MDFIPKNPVQNPCEAASFEEAFSKNHRRLAFELRMTTDLWNEMPLKERNESVNPDFWKGALAANVEARKVFEEEWNRFAENVAKRVKTLKAEKEENSWKEGFDSIRDSATKALETNDPQTIVYW